MRGHRESPILPIGSINLKTGSSLYFNVYETWGEDTTYELYEVRTYVNGAYRRGYRVVATSGRTPIQKIGEHRDFIHDQTGRFMFRGKMLDFAVGSDLKKFTEKYNIKAVRGATYK